MKIIAFLSNKGGVGKTASSVTVAHIAATVYKKRVLYIDLDPQGNSSSFFGNDDIMQVLLSIIKGQTSGEVSKSVEDIFRDSHMDIHDAIRHTKYENLDIIPAYLTLSTAEEELKADIKHPQQFRLLHHLNKIQDEYDLCFLDCSPSVSIININGLAAADEVFIPLKCDAWSAIGMCIARNLVLEISTYNPRLKIGGLFFTQWEGRKTVSNTVYDLLQGTFPDLLLPFTIAKSKLIEEITLMQIPLLDYDSKKNPAKVTRDYKELTEYILADPIQRLSLKKSKKDQLNK